MLVALLTTAVLQQPVPAPDFTSRELWDAWPGERALTVAAPCLRHQQLLAELQSLDREFGDGLRVEEVGCLPSTILGRASRVARTSTVLPCPSTVPWD